LTASLLVALPGTHCIVCIQCTLRLSVCGPVLPYKDTLKVNLKQCGIDPSALGDDTQDRSAWRTLCHEAVTQFEDSRVEGLEHKRAAGRGFNLAATSALGHETAALASAAPELDSTLINKFTDDKRSVVFDGAVPSVTHFRHQYRAHIGWLEFFQNNFTVE